MGNIEVRPTSPSLSDNDSNADNDSTTSLSEVVLPSARLNDDCDDDGGDANDDNDDDDDDVIRSEAENRTNVSNRTNRQQRTTSGRRKDVARRNRPTVAANENGRGDTEQPPWSVVVEDHAGGSSQAAAGRRARTSRPPQVRQRSRSPCTRLSCSRTHHRNQSRVSHRSRRWSTDPVEPVVMIAPEERVVVAKPQPRPRRSKRTTAGQWRRRN